MPQLHIDSFMAVFGPSNEGSDEVTGTWDYELQQQLSEDEGRQSLAYHMHRIAEALPLEPVVVDFNPHRIHDGHSRVLAVWLMSKTGLGGDTIEYGSLV